jgi:hypothetical protein
VEQSKTAPFKDIYRIIDVDLLVAITAHTLVHRVLINVNAAAYLIKSLADKL